jgi:hypothetical protein
VVPPPPPEHALSSTAPATTTAPIRRCMPGTSRSMLAATGSQAVGKGQEFPGLSIRM